MHVTTLRPGRQNTENFSDEIKEAYKHTCSNLDNFNCTCPKASVYDLKIDIGKIFFVFANTFATIRWERFLLGQRVRSFAKRIWFSF